MFRERILDDTAFHQAVNAAGRSIRAAAKLGASESTIAGAFERELHAVLRDFGIPFSPVKEDHVSGLRHKANGRIDARLGQLIVEYKKPEEFATQRKVEAAVEQANDYLIALHRDHKTAMIAFITDGQRLAESRISADGTITESSPRPLDKDALITICRSVVRLQLTALVGENLINDFCGAGDENAGPLFELARTFRSVLIRKPTPKTHMLRLEWEELFRLGHDDKSQQVRIQQRRQALSKVFRDNLDTAEDEYTALFAIQSAYALALKLVAYRVLADISKMRPQKYSATVDADSSVVREFCSRLEDGEYFRKIGILNLLEGDFFSWYSDKKQWNSEVANHVKGLLRTLGRYENSASVFESESAIDLFKDLYEAVMPRAVRSSFGEFYTPSWLAEHVIDSARLPKGGRLIDPCAGSGTFLIAAIKRERKLSTSTKSSLLRDIVSRVVGIDLNPLAVLTARINYFVHIADLTKTDPIVIPVYLGDSTELPEKVDCGGVPCLQYKLKTLKNPINITIPTLLAESPTEYVPLMLNYEKAIQSANRSKALSILTSALPTKIRTKSVLDELKRLTDELIELSERGWNGIWARILTNFTITGALGQFDAIVGNPPWVDWRNLPTGYREKIKELCVIRGLFSGDLRTGGINLNICALIAYTSLQNWLSTSGRLCFLMPRELALQQSYEGWRRTMTQGKQSFEVFHDWSSAGHPFDPVREDFMTFVIGPEKHRDEIIPVVAFIKNTKTRKPAKAWKSKSEALSNLVGEDMFAGQVVPGKTLYTFAHSRNDLEHFRLIAGECSYLGREGMEFYPQELLLWEYVSPGRRPGTIVVRNIQVGKSKYRIPQRDFPIESRFLYPLARGAELGQFSRDSANLLVAFPYRNENPKRPLDRTALQELSPLLLDFYLENEEVIRMQTEFSDKIRGKDSGEFYGVARTGPYCFAPVRVAFRDNTKWCACVVSHDLVPWGENKLVLLQNHAVSICERVSGEFISEDEAHFICACLNAPSVEQFVLASSDNRSFKIRPQVTIPLYNPASNVHKSLSDLSRSAHANPKLIEEIRSQINTVYLSLCNTK